jgi:beta-glucanase (GH16 family)
MYIIVNLGMSKSFVPNPDPAIFSTFPVTMFVDYIRVYQPKGSKNIGCDPPGFPTTDYINKYVRSSGVRDAEG